MKDQFSNSSKFDYHDVRFSVFPLHMC